MSKYEPLRQFLDQSDQTRVTLTFAKVEQILGVKLPPSAYNHQAWWANNPEGHSHSRAWIEAGWRTENLNVSAGKVDFARQVSESQVDRPASEKVLDPWGALAGTVTIHDPVALTTPSDEYWESEGGQS